MKTQLCTAFFLAFLSFASAAAFADEVNVFANGMPASQAVRATEKLKLAMAAKQEGVPSLIFDRAMANYEKQLQSNQTSSNCFMAADLTSEQPQSWRICSNPQKVEKMPLQVGSGDTAGCAPHVFKNNGCMKFFGNRKNYCLPSGGNYVTEDVYSARPNQSPFVVLKGLDTGLNDNSAGGVGLQQAGADGKVAWDPKSQSIFALPAPKSDGMKMQDFSAKRTGGGMSVYIYPAREDIKRFREMGSANYWSADCESKIGKPGWLGDKKASDTPSPSEVSAAAVPLKSDSAKSDAGGR